MDSTQGTAKSAVVGRRLGLATFWFLAIYVAVFSCYSVVAQLFFSSPVQASGSAASSCQAEGVQLDQQLRQGATRLLWEENPRAIEQWLIGWDKDFRTHQVRCPTATALWEFRKQTEHTLKYHQAKVTPFRKRVGGPSGTPAHDAHTDENIR